MSAATLTVDLDALTGNWHRLSLMTATPATLVGLTEAAAVVKADAYGCGLAPVALALWDEGCSSFFVATPQEGIALRAILPDADIYILNGVCDRAEDAKAHALIPCLNAPHQVAAWRQAGGGPCALQIDTGMARLGVQPGDLAQLLETERETLAGCVLVMSHLACADDPDHPQNAAQRAAFDDMIPVVRAVAPNALASLAATGGTLLGPEYHYDLVRCGIGLYGGMPFAEAEPVVTLTAPVIQIRDIPAGTPVGYGADWIAPRPSRIATLPLGYADGFHRALSGATGVWIDGRPAPLAGRVSMDLLTVDVTEFPGLGPGDPVEILGPHRSIDALATDAGTIGYEVLTALGSRYERRYKGADRN